MATHARKKRLGWLFWSSLIVVLLAVCGIVYLVWWMQPKYVAEPIINPSVTASAEPSPSPSPTATKQQVTPPVSPLLPNPKGAPVSLEVKRGSKHILGMNFAPRVTDGKKFTSQCGKVAVWDIVDAPMPGEASKYMALITGHMRCKPDVYSLDKLGTVKKGDLLTVTFSSGEKTVSRARADVISVGKGQLNDKDNPENYTNKEVAQVTRLTTCDKTSKVRGDGHVENNLAVWFVRIK